MSKNDNDTDTSTPLVDPRYVKKVFHILSGMVVQLDEDPLDYSPKRLSGKVQVCRSYMNEVERLALDASKRLHDIKEQYRKVKRLYQIAEDKLLKSDSDVRAGRAIDDRRALARLKMPEAADELVWFEQGIEDMETVLGALKSKISGLRNIQGQLKEQRNLCNEGIGLGRSWMLKDKSGKVPLVPGQGRGAIAVAKETQALIDGMEIDLDSDVDLDPSVEDITEEAEEEANEEETEEEEDAEEEDEEADEEEDEDAEEEGEDEESTDDLDLDGEIDALVDGKAPRSKQGTMTAEEPPEEGDSEDEEGDSLLPPEDVEDPSRAKEQDENALSSLFDDDAFDGEGETKKTPEEEFLDLDGILDGIE